MSLLRRLKRFCKLMHLKIVRQKDSHHSIAIGVAIGMFICFAIPVGPQMATAFIMAWIFRANKKAAMAMVWITNPWTIGPIYTAQVYLGAWCGGKDMPADVIEKFVNALKGIKFFSWDFHSLSSFFSEYGTAITVNFFIGGTIFGLVTAIISYPLMLHIIDRHYVNKANRTAKRAERRAAKLQKIREVKKLEATATPVHDK